MACPPVHLFYADTRDFRHDGPPAEADLDLPCGAIGSPRRRLQSLAGRRLLSHALSTLYGSSAAQWRLATDAGKPRLVGADAPQLSLAHCRNRVVCALADHPVGVDIEYAKERNFTALARAICTDHEWHEFRRLSTTLRKERFYQLWTLKEAAYKALGRDITLQSLGFHFGVVPGPSSAPPGTPTLAVQIFTPAPDYFAAVGLLGVADLELVHHR